MQIYREAVVTAAFFARRMAGKHGNLRTREGGLAGQNIRALYVQNGYLLAGTNGSGTWRRPLNQITAVDEHPSESSSGVAVWAYPNPANERARIGFRIESPSDVRVTLHDALGRQVAVLVNGRVEAGIHSVEVLTGDLAPGIYLYRVGVGEEVRTGRLNVVR